MPTRVTLNDSKRQSWLADLANPDVPLYKLGKSVPHGAKGHDLLDLLQTNRVAIPRAVWFLRVLGANETVWSVKLIFDCVFNYSLGWSAQ
jgi:mediator of RNA polymerase II transcription subunit 12